jgi:hypothetical protein
LSLKDPLPPGRQEVPRQEVNVEMENENVVEHPAEKTSAKN